MPSVIVSEIEINRLITLILERYNEQFYLNQQTLTADDVSYEFVIQRDFYKNAVRLDTLAINDNLVLKVDIEYTLEIQPEITPFRLEVIQNTDGGEDTKIYIASAVFPRLLFPTLSRFTLSESNNPTVTWNSETQNFELEDEDNQFNLTLHRNTSSGNIVVTLSIQINNQPAYLQQVTFEDGEDVTNVFIDSLVFPITFIVTIQESEHYELGEITTISGTVSKQVYFDDLQCNVIELQNLSTAVGNWDTDDNDTPFFTWTPSFVAEKLIVDDDQSSILAENGSPYILSNHTLPESLLYIEFNSNSDISFDISNQQTPQVVNYVGKFVEVNNGEMYPIVLRTKSSISNEKLSFLIYLNSSGHNEQVQSSARIANDFENPYEASGTGIPLFNNAINRPNVIWNPDTISIAESGNGTGEITISDGSATAISLFNSDPPAQVVGFAESLITQVPEDRASYYEFKVTRPVQSGLDTGIGNTNRSLISGYDTSDASYFLIELSRESDGSAEYQYLEFFALGMSESAYINFTENNVLEAVFGFYIDPELGTKIFVKMGTSLNGWVSHYEPENIVTSPNFSGGVWIQGFMPFADYRATMHNPLTDEPCVLPPDPSVAQFISDYTPDICPPGPVQFTDQSTGNIQTWLWDFGDGNQSSEQNPEHIYLEPNTYTVTLTINEGTDDESIVQHDVVITCIDICEDVDNNTAPLIDLGNQVAPYGTLEASMSFDWSNYRIVNITHTWEGDYSSVGGGGWDAGNPPALTFTIEHNNLPISGTHCGEARVTFLHPGGDGEFGGTWGSYASLTVESNPEATNSENPISTGSAPAAVEMRVRFHINEGQLEFVSQDWIDLTSIDAVRNMGGSYGQGINIERVGNGIGIASVDVIISGHISLTETLTWLDGETGYKLVAFNFLLNEEYYEVLLSDPTNLVIVGDNPKIYQPAAETDPFWNDVVALLNFIGPDNSTNFIDEKGHGFSSVGDIHISTDRAPPGCTSSAYFDGVGDHLLTANSSDWILSNSNFAFETTIRPDAISGTQTLISQRRTSLDRHAFSWFLNSSGQLSFFWTNDGGTQLNVTTVDSGISAAGSFYHVRVARIDDVLYQFVNGVLKASGAISGSIHTSNQVLKIGALNDTPTAFFKGYMGPVRMTIGSGRDQTDFIVPNLPFPTS